MHVILTIQEGELRPVHVRPHSFLSKSPKIIVPGTTIIMAATYCILIMPPNTVLNILQKLTHVVFMISLLDWHCIHFRHRKLRHRK
jgi:hypothetical protein